MDKEYVLVGMVLIVALVSVFSVVSFSGHSESDSFNSGNAFFSKYYSHSAPSSVANRVSSFYDPVCGVDGKTYDNGCLAASAKVHIASVGVCESAICGNGILESSEECDVPGDHCMSGYGNSCSYCSSNCELIVVSGGFCGDGVCDVEESKDCSDCSVTCTDQYDPVCGTDDNTYSNGCFAAASGVEVSYKGECGTNIGHDPVDDKIVNNPLSTR